MHLKVLFMPNPEQPKQNPQFWDKRLLIYVLLSGSIVFLLLFQCSWPPKSGEWTGFGESQDEITVTEKSPDGKVKKTTTTIKKQPAKKLWDWLSLLGVPLTLATLGYYFQYQQNKAREAKENQDKEQQKLDKERAEEQQKLDKERAADQQRESALQAYFNELSALLIDKGLFEKLSGTIEDPAKEAMISLIGAKTRTILKMFDEDIPRKASVLSFLGDSSLLKQNLLNLDLSYINLTKAYLAKADLSKADLTRANLIGAIFYKANLEGSDLTRANLIGAIFYKANLKGADLTRANLTGAIFEGAIDLTLTNKQIKSACNWDKAIYTEARWDDEQGIWVAKDPQANEAKIKEIREDAASDPQTTPDCSIWNNT
jgi:uncharacterized protein YjbI with pentapeptide repeats